MITIEKTDNNSENIGIIFHSGSYDRVYHGLALALTSLAFDYDVKLFFTYWALSYVTKENSEKIILNSEAKLYEKQFNHHMEKGHIKKFSEMIQNLEKMGAKMYACSNSLDMLKIEKDQILKGISIAGLGKFLSETENYRIIFI